MSKWGSLLQGAVANIESRLDTILAEERNVKSTTAPKPSQPQSRDLHTQESVNGTAGLNRTSSIKKFTTNSSENGVRVSTDEERSKVAQHIRTSSPAAERGRSTSRANSQQPPTIKLLSGSDQSFYSVEKLNDKGASIAHDNVGFQREAESTKNGRLTPQSDGSTALLSSQQDSGRHSFDSLDNHDGTPISEIPSTIQNDHENDIGLDNSRALIVQLRKEREEADAQWQEETHTYLERIDALQAKLQYLAKEAAQSAQLHTSEASNGSHEQKLAVKDEQIALLMEEGQKLSKLEVGQAGLIRKLRVKAAEESRELAQTKQMLKRVEQVREEMREKIRKSESDQKEAAVKISRLNILEKEAHTLREDIKIKQSTIDEIKRQLEQEKRQRENLRQALSIANQSLAEERKTAQALRDDFEATRLELKQNEERAKGISRGAEADIQRERERSDAAESTFRREIQALESRLEAFRERSEELSSGTMGDTQAKLLRHIETLQTQYALASENWQGIENSLESRIAALEAEKDEASRHEVETRRKARDSSNAARRLQDELDSTLRKSKILEQELLEQRGVADKLQARATEFETQLRDAREAFEREKKGWQNSLTIRIEDEKTKWQQEQPRWSHTESPNASPDLSLPPPSSRKTSAFERPTFPLRRNMSSRFIASELNMTNIETRPLSRRSSSMRLNSADWAQPTPVWEHNRSGSASSPVLGQTPSIHTIDQDELFEDGASPHRTVNDMISVSTVAAGPSVQLVERMSATVRRLESEKAASKDELARLSTQRDEARQEVVSLMREVEEKRDVNMQARKYEAELAIVKQRYQTTLEMLGEKSEEVEEFKSDIADLKKMYRELVDTTMK